MKIKELLKQYAAYNSWANQKITDVILTLPEEKQQAELLSSYGSIYKTVLHLWDAESIWWQRMKMQERILRPSEDYKGTMHEAVYGLLQQSRQWEEWVNNASDMSLDHVFQFQNTKKESFKQPVYQMLQHVFNHGTHHRGQLINMLRQVGVEKIPPTDFFVWARGKK
jgi:uncharacterized damage-inducible protein DinB